jgi:hypothetical protein
MTLDQLRNHKEFSKGMIELYDIHIKEKKTETNAKGTLDKVFSFRDHSTHKFRTKQK